jgi:hypothetical protein
MYPDYPSRQRALHFLALPCRRRATPPPLSAHTYKAILSAGTATKICKTNNQNLMQKK